MTNLSKLLLFLSFIFTLVACKPDPVIITTKPTTDEYKNIKKAKDRKEILEDITKSYKGSPCNELDRKDKNKRKCEEQCKDMFGTITSRKECRKLKVSLIKDLYDQFKILEEADDLQDINSRLFEVYLNVSISGLSKIADRYSDNEAEDFLFWVLKNETILNIFRKEDNNHIMFEKILKKFDSNYNTNSLNTTFSKKLEGSELIEIAIRNSESQMMTWFLDFINDKNEACDKDTETKDCFEIYCKIGDELSEDDKAEWLEVSEFEDYLKDIISKKVNSRNADSSNAKRYNRNGWSYNRQGIEEFSDLSDDWVSDLCQDLI